MEEQKPTPGKFALNNGIYLGLVMVLINVTLYATGLVYEGVQWPNVIYYVLFPVVIFYTISKFKKANANELTIGLAIKVGLAVAMVSALVYVLYGLLFVYVIDPGFMDQMVELARDQMLERGDIPPEAIEQQMKFVEMFTNPLVANTFWIAASAFFGLIYSLIGGLVMRTNK
jgi:hypothetical protein